ncbi:uncharacterized protein LOC116023403 [Ipomoea triloba]|uniref:uncharacterized protein LOC116023403 n=1 Tax=Ipomoea triloba TaxID=35885 RepID=UPI00125D7C90|nr:uncharacterized protein LOC116023403 [Ipomoea triloba]
MLKGEILIAVGRDANNQMYPIAWGIVEIENTDSWRWFLGQLKSDLGITNTCHWTLISDQQKGLTHVIKSCFLTLSIITVQDMCTPIGVNYIEKQNSEFKKQYPPRFWCKAFFRTSVKCDIVDNNLCEAFNGTLVKARVKPIIPMLEDIRVGVMRRIAKKIKSVESWTGNYRPLVMKKLNTNIHKSMGWKVDFNGDDGYEIKKGRQQFKVKLTGRSCSCRAWDLSGIPCPHAICAIFDIGREPHDYIDSCYSKEAYLRTYAHALQPMNGELFWPKTQNEEILAPIPKNMTRRPKRKITREASEGPSRSKKNTSTTGNTTSTSA